MDLPVDRPADLQKAGPRVLLVQPPVFDFALYDLFLKPLGLLRIGRWLQEEGYRVEILNYLDYRDPASAARLGRPRRRADGTGKLFREGRPAPAQVAGVPRRFARYGVLEETARRRLAETALRSRPDLVLLATGMTYWYPGVREAARAVRRALPAVPMAAGGVYATLCPDHCRSVTEADWVVEGPAAGPLRGILRSLGLPVPTGAVPAAPLVEPGLLTEAAVIQLNRGCPYRCEYCGSYALSGGFTPGDPDEILRALLELHGRLGTRNFAFYDDALLIDAERVLFPLLEQIRRASLGLRFSVPNAVHLSRIDGRCARLLRAAGFREVRIGLESAREDFHRERDGKLRVEMLAAAVDELRSAGFALGEIRVYLLAGLPRQHRQEVEQSIRFAASCGTRIELAEYSPVPRSALWERSVAESRYPLEEEPLVHNNSVLPMEWSGLDRTALRRLKELARSLSPRA